MKEINIIYRHGQQYSHTGVCEFTGNFIIIHDRDNVMYVYNLSDIRKIECYNKAINS